MIFLLVPALGALAAALIFQTLPGWAQWPALALTLAAGAILIGLRLRAGRRRYRAANAKHVLIDGSNVMHWNAGTPDIAVLRAIVRALIAKGYTASVILDANAGYKLFGRHTGAAALARHLGLPESRVMLSPGGTQADGFLLQAARDMDAPILTNDRFRDWQDSFPEITRPGRLIHGGCRDGVPYLRPGKGKPGPAPCADA